MQDDNELRRIYIMNRVIIQSFYVLCMCMMMTFGGFHRLARRNENFLEFHFTEALMLMGRDESGAILRPKLRSGIDYEEASGD
jgi:hypothetical protein